MSNNNADITKVSELSAHQTKLPGMLLFDLNKFDDPRGSFTEIWQTETMQKLGLPEFNPKQLGVSRSKKGTIRAIHAEPYAKILSPLTGRIFVAMVDLRTDSETFGKVDSFTLTPAQMLYVPSGIGNAFQAVSDEDVLYCYCVSDVWSPEKAYSGSYIAVNYADPDLDIAWPILGGKEIVSIKDKQNKTMRELFPEKYQKADNV